MNLLPHQIKYAKGYKDKAFLVHEGGTGKTVCACVWLHDGRDTDALVICSKRIIKKWQQALKDWQTKAVVVSKEQFKKMDVQKWSAVIVDEADEFASPLFVKGRSQLAESLYKLVELYPKMPVMLLTATPIRSSPWNLHTLLCYLGIYYDWKEWRKKFYSLEYRPFLPRPAWLVKDDWRQTIRPILEKHADIVLLKDCVDFLPPVEQTVLKSKYTRFTGILSPEPSRAFVEKHLFEQINKDKQIIEIGKDYRKILVVAYYVDQVEELAKKLKKDRQVFMVHGSVKNQEELLEQANKTDECFLIVQASLGVGFDADSFSCIVFTSMSYKVRDFMQMKYRVRRIKNLHPVRYYYLINGKCDEQVYETIERGKEFVPSEWIAETE